MGASAMITTLLIAAPLVLPHGLGVDAPVRIVDAAPPAAVQVASAAVEPVSTTQSVSRLASSARRARRPLPLVSRRVNTPAPQILAANFTAARASRPLD